MEGCHRGEYVNALRLAMPQAPCVTSTLQPLHTVPNRLSLGVTSPPTPLGAMTSLGTLLSILSQDVAASSTWTTIWRESFEHGPLHRPTSAAERRLRGPYNLW